MTQKNKIIDTICSRTTSFIINTSKSERKKYGQFFTSKEIAIYMASLFDLQENKCEFKILDAGAGSGILSAAILDKLRPMKHISKLYLTCYENDENILPLLKSNLEYIKTQMPNRLEYEIIEDNYILSQNFERKGTNDTNFLYDIIIGNPPYLKIAKDAPEALAMPSVCYGAPNLYFLFMAMGVYNLKPGCEMIYIIPRSWTSGAYFQKFRDYLFENCVLLQIHLFESRNKVFDNESILQETIIVKIKKAQTPSKKILITSSLSSDFSNITKLEVPYNIVVMPSNGYVYLPTNEKEKDSLLIINRLPKTLPALGLKMKTGIIVDFRTRNVLRNKKESMSYPLFYSQHIQGGKVIFPIGKNGEYIKTDKKGYLQKNKNYLFVKRFTSKEENRRLQCGIYLSNEYSEYEYISTQNKINFIEGVQLLSEEAIYGLFVLFNSSIYDMYYRILNGSTQVNSTEVNVIPIPTMNVIETMGKELKLSNDLSESNCNNILNKYINGQTEND